MRLGSRVPCCCGCGVGRRLQRPFSPLPGNLHVPQEVQLPAPRQQVLGTQLQLTPRPDLPEHHQSHRVGPGPQSPGGTAPQPAPLGTGLHPGPVDQPRPLNGSYQPTPSGQAVQKLCFLFAGSQVAEEPEVAENAFLLATRHWPLMETSLNRTPRDAQPWADKDSA